MKDCIVITREREKQREREKEKEKRERGRKRERPGIREEKRILKAKVVRS